MPRCKSLGIILFISENIPDFKGYFFDLRHPIDELIPEKISLKFKSQSKRNYLIDVELLLKTNQCGKVKTAQRRYRFLAEVFRALTTTHLVVSFTIHL